MTDAKSGAAPTAARNNDTDDIDIVRKQPELAPIKLSKTRKTATETNSAASHTNNTANDRLEPQKQTSNTSTAATNPALAAPPPAVLIATADRYSSDILNPVVPATQKQTPLERAVNDRKTINEKDLVDSVARLQLSNSINKDVISVIVKSLLENALTFSALLTSLKDLSQASRTQLLTETLETFRQKKGDVQLIQLVGTAQTQLLEALTEHPSPSPQLDVYLRAHHLLILKPLPDLTASIQTALTQGDEPSTIIRMVDDAVDPSIPLHSVAKIFCEYLFQKVFINKTTADITQIIHYQLLAKRLLNDSISKTNSLFIAQSYWFKQGGNKNILKETMLNLLNLNIIQVINLINWRDDLKDKTLGKPKALLQVNNWIKELEEKMKEEERKRALAAGEIDEDEDEDDDDEDDDDDDDDDDD